jgi:hypothetical protein
VFAGPTNPDLSIIGDARAAFSDARAGSLSFEELEVSIVGPLNPYASATAVLGITAEEGVDIEEAKLSLDRYLPGGFGLTAGKALLDFGQLNPVHAHAFPFVDRPLMHAAFFGEEGAKDAMVRLDWIAPTSGLSVRGSAAVVRGDVFLGEAEPDGARAEEGAPEIGAGGRVDVFAEPSTNTSFLLGASALSGEFDPTSGARVTWFGPDLKVRFDLGPANVLVLNAEAMWGAREAGGGVGSMDPHGWFASADWRATRRWNLGGFAESTTLADDDAASISRFGAFAGLALMEESTVFRMVGRVTDPEDGESEADLILQAIFALGPHQAHRY